MKSNLTNLVIAFVLLTFASFPSDVFGQTDTYAAPVASGQSTVTFTFMKSGDATRTSDVSRPAAISLGLEEASFTSLLDHGFFYDGVTNHMYVNTAYDEMYTRVEIISKSTKEHLFDGALGNALTATEIQDLESGTYKFIFTNEAGNIKVDELNVMTIKRQDLLLANNDD